MSNEGLAYAFKLDVRSIPKPENQDENAILVTKEIGDEMLLIDQPKQDIGVAILGQEREPGGGVGLLNQLEPPMLVRPESHQEVDLLVPRGVLPHSLGHGLVLFVSARRNAHERLLVQPEGEPIRRIEIDGGAGQGFCGREPVRDAGDSGAGGDHVAGEGLPVERGEVAEELAVPPDAVDVVAQLDLLRGRHLASEGAADASLQGGECAGMDDCVDRFQMDSQHRRSGSVAAAFMRSFPTSSSSCSIAIDRAHTVL